MSERKVSRRDALAMQGMVAAGMTPEEAAGEFPQYGLAAAVAAAGRSPIPNDIRDLIFWSILAGQTFPEIAEKAAVTERQVVWVETFYVPAEVRAQIAMLDRRGFGTDDIFATLAEQGRAISETAVRGVARYVRWARIRRERKGKYILARGHEPNRKQKLAADPNAAVRGPSYEQLKNPDFCSFEEWAERRRRKREVELGAVR